MVRRCRIGSVEVYQRGGPKGSRAYGRFDSRKHPEFTEIMMSVYDAYEAGVDDGDGYGNDMDEQYYGVRSDGENAEAAEYQDDVGDAGSEEARSQDGSVVADSDEVEELEEEVEDSDAIEEDSASEPVSDAEASEPEASEEEEIDTTDSEIEASEIEESEAEAEDRDIEIATLRTANWRTATLRTIATSRPAARLNTTADRKLSLQLKTAAARTTLAVCMSMAVELKTILKAMQAAWLLMTSRRTATRTTQATPINSRACTSTQATGNTTAIAKWLAATLVMCS